MSDMASILGLILLAFTWLALRGMGRNDKPRRRSQRPSDSSSSSMPPPQGPSHQGAP